VKGGQRLLKFDQRCFNFDQLVQGVACFKRLGMRLESRSSGVPPYLEIDNLSHGLSSAILRQFAILSRHDEPAIFDSNVTGFRGAIFSVSRLRKKAFCPLFVALCGFCRRAFHAAY
jgi:hypothetical protein